MNFLDTFSHLGFPTSCKMWHYFDKVLQLEEKWKKKEIKQKQIDMFLSKYS